MKAVLSIFLPSLLIAATWASVSVNITNQWPGGFQFDVCITFAQEVISWRATVEVAVDVNQFEVWHAYLTMINSREFQLDSLSWSSHQTAGATLCFPIVIRCNCNAVPSFTFSVENIGSTTYQGIPDFGSTGGGGGGCGTGGGGSGGGIGGPGNETSSTEKDYSEALRLSILFYETQRSGDLPADNPIPWRGDSALSDCVPGGWYDAGDHLKFGLPMASSATLLSWGLIRFKDGYQQSGQLDNMYDMIKWPLDYFLAAWDPSGTGSLVVQVGDGDLDHAYWGRAEEMIMSRPCQTITSGSQGSDVAAETAASLAAGSIAFRDKGDISYADTLLTAAQQLYTFASSSRGVFTGSAPFYQTLSDSDELCLAAMWLYKAMPNNTQYLIDAQTYVEDVVGWALSWDNKIVACQILLYEETASSAYLTNIEAFFTSWMTEVTYTPCGLAWRDQWGANRYAGTSAFAALVAAEDGINAAEYREFAVEQINYLLGDNSVNGGCFSFLVGYGTNYPLQPHHRGASCPDLPATCTWDQYNSPNSNPQVLNGALVGGPDASDNFQDLRSDFIQSEVATDYNSGFQGALAGIIKLQATSSMPTTATTVCHCAE